MSRYFIAVIFVLVSHRLAPAECLTEACHLKMSEQVRSFTVKHGALRENDCTVCHVDHTRGEPGILKDSQDSLCYSCHRSFGAFIRQSAYRHPLAGQGKCSACHNPHGGNFTDLLPLYARSCMDTRPWMPMLELCLGCHEDKKSGSEDGGATGFRNGEYNLHEVHVSGEKGRKCQACHDSHASDQTLHIRKEVPFGNGGWKLPIVFTQTATGGSCLVGCHREYGYDRVNPFDYGE